MEQKCQNNNDPFTMKFFLVVYIIDCLVETISEIYDNNNNNNNNNK